MTDPGWYARVQVEFLAACDESDQDRATFARLASARGSELVPGCAVGVALLAGDGEPAAGAGSTGPIGALEESDPPSGRDLTVGGVPDEQRWADVGSAASALGYRAVFVYPVRHYEVTHGVIEVFVPENVSPPCPEVMAPFADLVAAHLTHLAVARGTRARTLQLEQALTGRIIIEQAKGMLAQRFGITMDSAFGSMRSHARSHRLPLAELCTKITHGDFDLADLAVEAHTMPAARRAALRDEAMRRWRTASIEASSQRERAAAALSRTAELRIEREHRRALRDVDSVGRSIDRHFRQVRDGRGTRPRVLVGDERDPVRSFVSDAVARDARTELVGTAATNSEVLAYGIVEQPDLLVLGPSLVGTPEGMLISQLRAFCPDSRALRLVDHVRDARVTGHDGIDMVVVGDDTRTLIDHVLRVCAAPGPTDVVMPASIPAKPPFDLVVVAASAGGINALSTLLGALPAGFPAPVLIVQHLDPRHRSLLAEILSRRCRLPVAEAVANERIEPGRAYLAPPNKHLLVNSDATLALTESELVHFVRPSADLLFESAAGSHHNQVIAVVLTGTGADGSMGVRAVKKVGGTVIAQDEASSEFFGMPGTAIATGDVDFVLPLDEIAPALITLVHAGTPT